MKTRIRKATELDNRTYGEFSHFKYLMSVYPKGILSIVSDTFDLWKVCTEYLPELKEEILTRDGKIVIRPDSGNPVDILCGINPSDIVDMEDIFNDDVYESFEEKYKFFKEAINDHIEDLMNEYSDDDEELPENFSGFFKFGNKLYNVEADIKHTWLSFANCYDFKITINTFKETKFTPAQKGVVELLWDVFGGTINDKGYKVLDPHIGAIYGDSITLDIADEICYRLEEKGFASTNVVLGIGSYTYQMNTRDTFGMAIKATYGEVTTFAKGSHAMKIVEPRNIFKAPVTDSGLKVSAKGLLCVDYDEYGNIVLHQEVSAEREKTGLLKTKFLNGELVNETTFDEIRQRLNG